MRRNFAIEIVILRHMGSPREGHTVPNLAKLNRHNQCRICHRLMLFGSFSLDRYSYNSCKWQKSRVGKNLLQLLDSSMSVLIVLRSTKQNSCMILSADASANERSETNLGNRVVVMVVFGCRQLATVGDFWWTTYWTFWKVTFFNFNAWAMSFIDFKLNLKMKNL